MVLNQWQVFVVVSDWEPYLGSRLWIVVGGLLSMLCCMLAQCFYSSHIRLVSLFVLFSVLRVFLSIIEVCIHTTLRFGLLITTIVTPLFTAYVVSILAKVTSLST